MEQYKFKSEHSQMLVDAIVEGYREYIDHRKDRKRNMKISSAFAWTKGNFIESKIADYCGEQGFTHKKSKAGLTWDYLQFTHEESKVLFLIKNAAYFNENSFSSAKLPTGVDNKGAFRTYLHDLSKINNDLEFSLIQPRRNEHGELERVEQLSFPISESQVSRVKEELEHLASTYNEFHILTYAIDDAYQISKVQHYLPNPNDNIAYFIEDLSDLISGAELDDSEREALTPDVEDIVDPAAYDIEILEGEQRG
ncbi:hypothetical protein MKY66_01255 [Paenibacillus sp. FSL R5-0766]|uniref:spr1630 family ClpXP-sensitive toxin n=1 Tax=Paenibacillus TaxID=44249 RepID=UPI00096C1B18|nr:MULTISPECIES: hypothetical protein [Paenibacillus]MCF7758225.1 hypothetical protein [Paenibacillus xylanexedens]OMF65993.1 hypothetical protein BK141_09185 [Paenibacillus sp. FSL R5-0765]